LTEDRQRLLDREYSPKFSRDCSSVQALLPGTAFQDETLRSRERGSRNKVRVPPALSRKMGSTLVSKNSKSSASVVLVEAVAGSPSAFSLQGSKARLIARMREYPCYTQQRKTTAACPLSCRRHCLPILRSDDLRASIELYRD